MRFIAPDPLQGTDNMAVFFEQKNPEPTGYAGINVATGRPFPPPRARPVILGVADIVGYALVLRGTFATPDGFSFNHPANTRQTHDKHME